MVLENLRENTRKKNKKERIMGLRDVILAVKNNRLFNLLIEGDSRIVINCYNKNNNISNYVMLLMKNIWKLSHDLNIYDCHRIYIEANRITDCLAKKSICNLKSTIWCLNFPKDVRKFGFEDYYDLSFNSICRYFAS